MNPLVSLTLSIQSNPGGYALLLGSGVSRSAGIPTGWEVVLELIRRLAVAEGEDVGPDSADWFRKKYASEPRYDALLESVAKSPQDRRSLLRGFFEPTPDERDRQNKMPSQAHKAIAELVAGGFIRLIVTTNFDRLIEQALDELGVRPNIIDNTDSIVGAPPLSSGEVFVVKVHGDYLDARIRNTPEELASYEPQMAAFIRRVFSEFGLVICGWSGEWDAGLREALRDSSNESTGTYWVSRSEPTGEAAALITDLDATVVRVRDADTFAQDLRDRVVALDELAKGRDLSSAIAIANVKRYLPDPVHRIRLRDLVLEEVQRLLHETRRETFPVSPGLSADEVLGRLKVYERLVEPLSAIMSVGCFYGRGTHDALWIECLEQCAKRRGENIGNPVLLDLERYPALLLLYAGGMACLAGGEYGTLAALLTGATVRQHNDEKMAVQVLNAPGLGESDWKFLPGREHEPTPLSNLLFESLRPMVREVFVDDGRYEGAFDTYEYLAALVYFDLRKSEEDMQWPWGPIGRFGWKDRRYKGHTVMERLEHEIEEAGVAWGPIQAGLFQGTLERAMEVKQAYDSWLVKATPGW